MLPDTCADENIIGPRHLRDIALSTSHLKPPPDSPRFTADGSVMNLALGSFLAELKVKAKTTRAWIDVHEGMPVPLLSYKACRDLALIPAEFPQPISQVIHSRMRAREETRDGEVLVPQPPTSLPSAALSYTSPPPSLSTPAMDRALPFDNTTTPAQAKEFFFFREYSDVLMTKEDTTPYESTTNADTPAGGFATIHHLHTPADTTRFPGCHAAGTAVSGGVMMESLHLQVMIRHLGATHLLQSRIPLTWPYGICSDGRRLLSERTVWLCKVSRTA
ncbi:hypothetical protein E2C01_034939 [Portunus trituberculatus]|uniref:Uncharacterized protein n=1 Tax=Portunus trituberculatus TaxID=210409 RepID=A0A5B7F2V5_PORTR|nr:hypothetical protein [Portunus trituberculatus]